jgi:SOS-response transcriptional repressor LexA/DNA-binding XRE family transcriptional regulator
MRHRRKTATSDWSRTIESLRRRLTHTQCGLAKELNTSAMAVSRWERGLQEPPAELYIQLGNLAGDPECWYFWERAGLTGADLMRVLPTALSRPRAARLSPKLKIVHAGASQRLTQERQLVAIPLLPVYAGTHGVKGDHVARLDQTPPESMLAAPSEWCPNPAFTNCLRIKGNSMAPTIQNGYVVAVDASQVERTKLYGKVIIAWHKDEGLIVSRLRHIDGIELLMPDSRDFEPMSLSGDRSWRILGKVLWWVGLAA